LLRRVRNIIGQLALRAHVALLQLRDLLRFLRVGRVGTLNRGFVGSDLILVILKFRPVTRDARCIDEADVDFGLLRIGASRREHGEEEGSGKTTHG
jgi:hypothetical protein